MALAPVRILIVEDDQPTRERLRVGLAAHSEFTVDAVGTLKEGRRELANKPDVLLTDLRLPDGNGITLIREIRQILPKSEVMVISVLDDEANVVGAICAGAAGYILKDSFPEDIAVIVRDLIDGRSPISASIARYIVRRMQTDQMNDQEPVEARLTPREIDILWGIAKGFRYADIADHLGISRQTVPGHIKNIYRKLQVNTRGEAVFTALQQRLIRL